MSGQKKGNSKPKSKSLPIPMVKLVSFVSRYHVFVGARILSIVTLKTTRQSLLLSIERRFARAKNLSFVL